MRLALIGRDVSSSLSATIHKSLVSCSYDLLSVPEEYFEERIDGILARYDGLNVTMPYKRAVIPHLAECRGDAERLESCNTVVTENGKKIGYSTDGEGFMASLGEDVRGKKVLVLGAGGAAAAICGKLADSGARVTIFNRTRERAENLVKNLRIDAEVADKEMFFSEKYDIIVNATSVGMHDDLSPVDLTESNCPRVAVDIIYKRTVFLKRAEELGARTLDGTAMLVYQAAAADRLFTGEQPDAEKVRSVLKKLTEAIR